MYCKEPLLVPIKEELPPPEHTEIRPRCFICKHFPVCNIRMDYLKTAQLISEVLGSTASKYELFPLPVPVPEFEGIVIENYKDYFPEEVKSIKEKVGQFYTAKYVDANTVRFIYIFEGYYVLFTALFNAETNEYEISKGREICYNIDCTLDKSSLDDIQLGLLTFKEDMENMPEEKEEDIINTTFFSASLDCKFYEWEKGLTYYDGVRRLIAKYPCGIPIGENGEYYHLATYHKEPHKVPCFHPENGHVAFSPMPYPVYIPPKCNKNECKCHTRDELNEF